MIVALVVALLVAGGASSGLDKELKADRKHAAKVLENTEVRKPALDVIDSMRKISSESSKASQRFLSRGLKLGRDHERASDDIDAVLDSEAHEVAELDRQFLDKRDALRSVLTRAQWDSVFQRDSTKSGS